MNSLKMAFDRHPYFVTALNIVVFIFKLYHSLNERPVLRGNVVKNIDNITHILSWFC